MKPSRLMLTGEMSWAIIGLSYAWSGLGGWPLAPSYLHRALARTDSALLWGVAIGLPALLLLFASAREWICRRRGEADARRGWSIYQVERWAVVRRRLCLWMAFAWLYMLKQIVQLAVLATDSPARLMQQELLGGPGDVLRATAGIPIAFFGALMLLWFWSEGRRVSRDCRKQTGVFPAYAGR